MCKTTLYTSPTCSHSWLALRTPCVRLCAADEENDLLTCPLFRDGAKNSARHAPKPARALPGDCPICDFNGIYDHRDFRMVRDSTKGLGLGTYGSASKVYRQPRRGRGQDELLYGGWGLVFCSIM